MGRLMGMWRAWRDGIVDRRIAKVFSGRNFQEELDTFRLCLVLSLNDRLGGHRGEDGPPRKDAQEGQQTVQEIEQEILKWDYVRQRSECVRLASQQLVKMLQSAHDTNGMNPYPTPALSTPSHRFEGAPPLFRHLFETVPDVDVDDEDEVRQRRMRLEQKNVSHPAGFELQIRHSSIDHPEAGFGVFVARGEVPPGTVVALYPGNICNPEVLPEFAADNDYIISRYDGLCVDGSDWSARAIRLSKKLYDLWEALQQKGPPTTSSFLQERRTRAVDRRVMDAPDYFVGRSNVSVAAKKSSRRSVHSTSILQGAVTFPSDGAGRKTSQQEAGPKDKPKGQRGADGNLQHGAADQETATPMAEEKKSGTATKVAGEEVAGRKKGTVGESDVTADVDMMVASSGRKRGTAAESDVTADVDMMVASSAAARGTVKTASSAASAADGGGAATSEGKELAEAVKERMEMQRKDLEKEMAAVVEKAQEFFNVEDALECLAKYRNPFAIGNYVNHPPADKAPNLLAMQYTFMDDFPDHLVRWIPNVFALGKQDAGMYYNFQQNIVMPSVALVALEPIGEGEELLLNYRYNPRHEAIFPDWYHQPDVEEARRRWNSRFFLFNR